MTAVAAAFRRNRTRTITLGVLAVLFITATQGMKTEDWIITVLRGLSVGAVTFLVASGLSIIFGLMDVLNLAHGSLFMLGAYLGWTVYVRPDTFVDVLTPLALFGVGFILTPLWDGVIRRARLMPGLSQAWPWLSLIVAVLMLALTLPGYPISVWNPTVFSQSPGTYSLQLDQGLRTLPPQARFVDASPLAVLGGILVGGIALAASLVGFRRARTRSGGGIIAAQQRPARSVAIALIVAALGVGVYLLGDPLKQFFYSLDTTLLFLFAIAIATLSGVLLGAVIESTLIRPLYARPIYQLMLTLGLGFIGVELVRAIWGRPEIAVPRPSLFSSSGAGCPAETIGDWLANRCSTLTLLGTRVRTYNEVFIILVGLIVLVIVWLLIQRSRLGMILRAGVQNSEMVEALGINVRRVFTIVFAIGTGLATLGGVLAAPSSGLSLGMGESLLLLALIALAIGGLTSFPGAAAGAVLVGLLQQFIIKYGQIGIQLPFLAEPFKPSPPLVPASTVLLMVVILLIMPQGLFGRRE